MNKNEQNELTIDVQDGIIDSLKQAMQEVVNAQKDHDLIAANQLIWQANVAMSVFDDKKLSKILSTEWKLKRYFLTLPEGIEWENRLISSKNKMLNAKLALNILTNNQQQ